MKKLRADGLELKSVDKKTEKEFLDRWHYQKYVPSSVCLGLYDGSLLVEVMSFGKPRYNRRYDWELLRLCTMEGIIVHGGASRLLKKFVTENEGSIISYCNRSKFSGNVYHKLGFKSLGTVKSYHYEKNGRSYHRSAFQRWKLEKMFPQYSREEYTEKQIMLLEGYDRVEELQETFVLGVRWYVYKITFDDGDEYVGQHLDRGDAYNGSGTLCMRKIKSGHKFTKTIIAWCDSQDEADRIEIEEIKKSRLQGHNINLADGGHVPYSYTGLDREYYSNHAKKVWAEKHDEIVRSIKNRWQDEDYRKRLSEIHKNSGASIEAMALAREMSIKNRTGKPLSEETKKKIGESNKGRVRSEEAVTKWRMKTEGFRWFNDGKTCIRAKTCPEGFKPGRCKFKRKPTVSGRKWFNDGKHEVLAEACPEGFKPGRVAR